MTEIQDCQYQTRQTYTHLIKSIQEHVDLLNQKIKFNLDQLVSLSKEQHLEHHSIKVYSEELVEWSILCSNMIMRMNDMKEFLDRIDKIEDQHEQQVQMVFDKTYAMMKE